MNLMRIANWNCRGGFRGKYNHLFASEPDIAVIQECEKNHGLHFQNLWFGDNTNKGISIFAGANHKIALHPAYNPEFKYIIPIEVTGRDDFNLFAVWAMNDEDNHEKRYIAQVWQAFRWYHELLEYPSIIVGDFNWNLKWDANPSYPLLGNWADTMKIFRMYDIKSVYHKLYKEKFGKESMPTYFHCKKMAQPHHTDYCFVSKQFHIEKFGITSPADWLELSDHMALLIDTEE